VEKLFVSGCNHFFTFVVASIRLNHLSSAKSSLLYGGCSTKETV